MKIVRKYLPPISLLLISTLSVAYAATTLFTQTFPAVPSVTSFKANCTTLTSSVSTVGAGSSGASLFTCGGTCTFPNCGAVAAFNVTLPTAGGQTLSMTPTFTLPTGYTRFDVYDSVNGIDVAPQMTSGTAISLSRGGYIYYVQWSGAPATGLPTFSVTWTPTFTQTFPAIPVAASSFVSNCSTLTSGVSTVGVGSSGRNAFACGVSLATAAFNVTVPAGQTFSMTPTFALASPYTDLGICNFPCTSSQFLTSGTAVSLGRDGYYYFLDWSNAPAAGLPTFNISWT